MAIIDELNALLAESAESTIEDTWDALRHRVTVLSERAWEGRNRWPEVEAWLGNFDGRTGVAPEIERLHALFLLSQFLYIGSAETRVLLQAVYRDLFFIPLIQEVRQSLGGTRDTAKIKDAVEIALGKTRFLGVGNPSESGVHLLYYFRQENRLSKALFLDSGAMFSTSIDAAGKLVRSVANPEIDRYVFVDDVCGSGETAQIYSKNMLTELIELSGQMPGAKPPKLHYLAMFASAEGMERVRNCTLFGSNAEAVFELDGTYKSLSERSRIMRAAPPHIDGETLRLVALTYGTALWSDYPDGFDHNQFLLGFHHNTPDNTLPIIWWEGTSSVPWKPAFRRYPKL